MNSRLEHESMSRGYETASVKYHQVIDDISEQIGGALEKNLRDWRVKYVELGEIPAGLMPVYALPPRELPLPENGSIELVVSGNELMMRNRSVWTMESAAPFEELVRIHARLLEDGWRVEPKILEPGKGEHFFRAHKGAQLYEGFEEQTFPRTGREDEPARLVFRYLDRMERDQILPIFDAMIANPELPVETGLGFMNNMDRDQRTRLIETWMDREALPYQARVAIIRELERVGRKDEALARLQSLHAAALLSTGDQTDEVKELGRKITGDKNWKPTLPTEEEFIALGAQSVGTNATMEVEVGLNEPAVFLAPAEDDSAFALLSLEIEPSSIPEGLYTFSMSYRNGSELNSAGSSSSTAHSLEHPWKGQISHGFNENNFHATALEIGTNRFLIALEIK
ncbi:hypothetical protein P4C99_05320 [Pontiellaceae bacterium B1224]|nr:hypothetical protein [Pontiellaceae bacterium B1224]